MVVGIAFYIFNAIRVDDKESWLIIGGLLLVIWIGLCIIPVALTGFHFNTGEGEHNGYVTAVQKQGVFFKTGRAYVKTDNQSSQEDAYCVMDEEVYGQLQEYSDQKVRVKVKYFKWLFNGIKNCQGEGDIISEVNIIN